MANQLQKVIKGSLYWKISLTFLLLLVVVGMAYVVITAQMAEKHFEVKNQRLNSNIAESIKKEVKPFLNGELNEQATDEILHMMMAINPSIEVYLLGPDGKILNYVAPYKRVKLESVSLAPIQAFIATEGQEYITGDDPRNPGVTKVFSASKVEENGSVIGYVYVILASEEYESVSQFLWGDYVVRLGTRTMMITLGATLVIGLIAIAFITKNLQRVIDTVNHFRKGDMSARIAVKGNSEIDKLAIAFNEMADTIVGNIENLKSMENLRRELVGNVSHDLRTPLAVIHGYIETLMIRKDKMDAEEKDQYMKIVLDSTNKLKKLVEELFELSKLEARQIEPKKEPFFINELVADVVQKYQILAKEKNITIEADTVKDNVLVNADVSLIERVMQNLIDNALKYTPEGGTVTIASNENNQDVEIQVSDTGPGIPKEQIPFIFDRYHIGDKRISLDENSTGLGLAIVKKILEIHDRSINLSTKLNAGSSFSFQLPQYAVN